MELRPSTATIASQLSQRSYLRQFMTGMRAFGRVHWAAGPAFTVRLVPHRPDSPRARPGIFEEMLESVPAGHVIVVDTQGGGEAATIGDMMALRLVERGVAGVVSDGAVRDSEGLAQVPLPVCARAVTSAMRTGSFDIGGIGDTVVCGGVTVLPGDLVVMDVDGAIAVPVAIADEVLAAAVEQEDYEDWVVRRLRDGGVLDGLHPPSAEARAEFARWREAGRPEMTGAGDQSSRGQR
jgi:regulator of RNase E activity RraA